MRWFVSRIALLMAAAIPLPGCVSNAAYRNPAACAPGYTVRDDHRPCSVSTEQLRIDEFNPDRSNDSGARGKSWSYRLAFIEFDDRGEMFNRDELDLALDQIARAKQDADAINAARKAAANEANQDPPADVRPIVAVFVHGWKNNASDSSGNVWGFRQTLARLSYENGPPSANPWWSPVVGIYIGWRGAVTGAPVIQEFTFFDRHQKAENLPNAHVVEALMKVMRAAKGDHFDDAKTISLLIGHSFGGAVLETALSETLEDMVLAAGSARPLHSPANLIMLVNEAQEATRSYQLIESMMKNLQSQDHCHAQLLPNGSRQFENPIMVSISSTGDYATRAFFPLGQAIARPFNSLRSYDQPNALGFTRQTPMFFNTTAHLSQFQSHVIELAPPNTAPPPSACDAFLTFSVGRDHYRLIEKPRSVNHTPYWVMEMPPSIVPDHSTIFTQVFAEFLVQFMANTIR